MGEEHPPAQEERPDDESDSDTDSIPDLSRESGLRFHLRKRSELLKNYRAAYRYSAFFLCVHFFFLRVKGRKCRIVWCFYKVCNVSALGFLQVLVGGGGGGGCNDDVDCSDDLMLRQ